MPARKGRSVCAYKMLLNCDGRAFLLILQLREELCWKEECGWMAEAYPQASLGLRRLSYLCIKWHLSSLVERPVGHAVGLTKLWAE